MYATSPGLRPLVLPDLFTRWIVGLFIALSLMMAGMAAHAAPPPAGASISNQASATYSDATGNTVTVMSNVVQTTVQQVASLTLTANGTQNANPGGVVNYPHTLTNTGNGADTFNLTASNTAGLFSMTGVQIFADNGSGAPTGPAITGPVSVGAGMEFKFIVQGTVPAAATAGQTNTITVTATSVFDPTKTQSNTDVTTVTNNAVVTLSKAASVSSGPAGTAITYTLTYNNTGNTTATAVAITDVLPAGLTYTAGSARWSTTGATALSDIGGSSGTTPNTLTSSYTVGTKTLLVTLNQVPAGTSGTISFGVTVAAGTAPGILNNTATTSYNDGAGTVTGSSNTVPFTVSQLASVTLTGATVAGPAAPGSMVSFTNTVTNTGNGVDTFNITRGTGNFPSGTTFQLFKSDGVTPLVDTNGDSIPDTNTTGVRAYTARVVDQLPPNMTYVSGSGTGWTCSAGPYAGDTMVTCDFIGTINANGGTSVLQITARPTNHLTVTNYAAVDPTGSMSPPVPKTCTAANTPAGCAAPVASPVPVTVTGYAYGDLNHNSTKDAGEVGTGAAGGAIYIKITPRSGSACNYPATAIASVDPSTGAYSLPNVASGDYCLILARDTSLAGTSSGYPVGFIGTENPTRIIYLVVGAGVPPQQNFGLFKGSQLTGTVFADNGAGGGIANNGVKAGTEAGLGGITVNVMLNAAVWASAVTSGDGSFTLWVSPSGFETVTITPVLPAGYTPTGGSAGTTFGGSYTRPSVSYTLSSARNDTGIAFGMVAPNTLAPNGAQTAQPGTTVLYAHSYTAATGGQVTFTTANAASPANPAWSQVLYQDSNCNALLEASEPQVTAAITVTAGQKVCLIVKQFVPAGAGLGAQNAVTLSAAFSYTNAAPALGISTLSAIDVTTVGQAGDLALGKLVSNVTQAIAAATSVSAKPGDTLQYTLTATNNGTQPLSTLLVSDSTPAFTSFAGAGCPFTPPAGITGCAVTTQPAMGAQGALQWTFTGSLAPGAQVTVTYNVKLDQ